MELEFQTCFYPSGWEVEGLLTVDANRMDDSFSHEFGTEQAHHDEMDFVSFVPDNLARDVRRQVEAPTRKRRRKLARQLIRRFTRELAANGEALFSEWLKQNDDAVTDALNDRETDYEYDHE